VPGGAVDRHDGDMKMDDQSKGGSQELAAEERWTLFIPPVPPPAPDRDHRSAERMVWVLNQPRRSRRRVHELDCKRLRAMWANPDVYVSKAAYTKMRAAEVSPGYHWCRHCAPDAR
jgi:hypothetical protein